MSFKKDLKLLLKPYYWINIILGLSFVIAKRFPVLCNLVFQKSDCELDGRETEILFFLIIVVMIRTRKAGSVTMINYLTASFIYTKIANLLLWFHADVRLGVLYGILFVLVGLLLPEPTYMGPENVIYFRGLQNMDDEMQKDKRVVWLVCFYAAWHPACTTFAPIFAQLSSSFHLHNFKFGKLDVGRFPDAAKKYGILDGPLSRQLPSLLLFKEGAEIERRPQADSHRKLQKFLFSEDNIKAAFDLPNLHKECKEKLAKRAAKAAKKEE